LVLAHLNLFGDADLSVNFDTRSFTRIPRATGMPLGVDSAMTPDQIEQAIIGFGSAIIGAIVGGSFVLHAARTQERRDEKEASRQAAKRILTVLGLVEGVLATWKAGQVLPQGEAATAFNTFSTATVADLPFILDEQLCERVRAHIELCAPLIGLGSEGKRLPPKIIDATRRHTDAVIEALQAHIRGKNLPAYKPLPKSHAGTVDLEQLVTWPD
jgi:hypothetical protein